MENQKPIIKAIILVGGFGTRLRPLTFTKAKPLVEFCNVPILCHQIEALVKVGVDEIILAINYQPERMNNFIEQVEKDYKVRIITSKEDEPLGTAGPIGLARDKYLKGKHIDYLFVFNADITCAYPLQELLDFHIKKGGEGTLTVTKVKDPSKYGVILTDDNRKIEKFIEKPQDFISDRINAGLYCFSGSFLNRIETKPTSIEKEVFPKMAEEGRLYAMDLEGFWMDIGQPKDFLKGTELYLNHLNKTQKDRLAVESDIVTGSVMLADDVIIEKGALVGPNVVLGPGCVVKHGARVKNSVLLAGSSVREFANVDNTIIGWKSTVGKWVKIRGVSIIAEDCKISDEVFIDRSIILPNLTVKNDQKEGTILLC